jgi:Family of unknown function (DUF6843)
MLSGAWLFGSIFLLGLWFVLMLKRFLSLVAETKSNQGRRPRALLTVIGFGLSTLAVGAVLALHLTWVLPGVSQRLGINGIRIFFILIFWPALLGLLAGLPGSGKVRWLGVGSSVMMGMWLVYLAVASGIAMGPPLARHPTRFLIPNGYVGWVKVEYGESGAPPLRMVAGKYICRIPDDAELRTSSPLEYGWSRDEYVYYSNDGSERTLPLSGWGGGGMIWGGFTSGSNGDQITESFFVGTERQFQKSEPPPRPAGTK